MSSHQGAQVGIRGVVPELKNYFVILSVMTQIILIEHKEAARPE